MEKKSATRSDPADQPVTTFQNPLLMNILDIQHELSLGKTLSAHTFIREEDHWIYAFKLEDQPCLLRPIGRHRARRFLSLTSLYNFANDKLHADNIYVRQKHRKETLK